MLRLKVSVGDEKSVYVTVLCKHLNHIDEKQLKNIQFRADRAYVSSTGKCIHLEYNIDNKTYTEVLDTVKHDLQLIEEYFSKYKGVESVVKLLKSEFGIDDSTLCPLTRQPCTERCRFYDWVWDRCDLFNIEVYCG